MVLQGVIGKLGAVFIIIPQPIVGGLFCVMFGMISAFGKLTHFLLLRPLKKIRILLVHILRISYLVAKIYVAEYIDVGEFIPN